MALTLTAAELRGALRLGDTAEERAEVARLLSFATAAVTRHLGDAFATIPDAIANESVVRLGAYLADMPNAGRGSGYADAIRNSGALSILAPFRIHRAGVAEAVDHA